MHKDLKVNRSASVFFTSYMDNSTFDVHDGDRITVPGGYGLRPFSGEFQGRLSAAAGQRPGLFDQFRKAIDKIPHCSSLSDNSRGVDVNM